MINRSADTSRQQQMPNEIPRREKPRLVNSFDFFELSGIPAALLSTDLKLLKANQPFDESFHVCDGQVLGKCVQHACPSQPDGSCPTQGCRSLPLQPYLGMLHTKVPQVSIDVELTLGCRQQIRFAQGPNGTLLLTLHNIDPGSDEAIKLEQLRENLLWASKDLAEFAHAATHDLRSPLRALRTIPNWIDADLEEAYGQVPELVGHHLELMRQQGQRLENMLDDLLAYTAICRFDEVSQPVSLLQTIDKLRDDMLLPQQFVLEAPAQDAWLRVPQEELHLALHNLIDNAIRHHHRSAGQITIETYSPNQHLLICVIDDGPGIPERYHYKALSAFSTLHSRDKREGSGLGLPIVHKIVHHWGGKLSISPGTADRGTRITLEIPPTRCAA